MRATRACPIAITWKIARKSRAASGTSPAAPLDSPRQSVADRRGGHAGDDPGGTGFVGRQCGRCRTSPATSPASTDEATWVLTSYLVSNAIVLPMTGWLSSFFGRKRFLIGCICPVHRGVDGLRHGARAGIV